MNIEIAPPIEGWPCNQISANYHENPNRWQTVDEDFYHEMLGAVPPIHHGDGRFMLGEPYHHDEKGVIYIGVVHHKGGYYAKHCYRHEFLANVADLRSFLKAPTLAVS